MKVYLYNTDTGIYLGEDYSSKKTALVVEGETTIAPPSYEPGEVAIFDQASSQWRVLSIDRVQNMIKSGGLSWK